MTDQPQFYVQGRDEQQYPADSESLTRWIREGRVAPEQMVFISSEQRWVPARALDLGGTSKSIGLTPLIIGAAVCLAVLVLILFTVGLVTSWNERVATEKARAQMRSERDQRESQLRQRAPMAAQTAQAHLLEIAASERSGELGGVDESLAQLKETLQPYMSLKPVPDVLLTPTRDYVAATERAAMRAKLMRDYETARASHRTAKELIQQKRWVDADDELGRALASIQKLAQDRSQARVAMPASFEPSIDETAIQKDRRRIQSNVKRQRERDAIQRRQQEAEEKKRQVLAAVCGTAPFRSAWDGGYSVIESALKRVAHDPGSIDVENCTDSVLYRDRCWVTTCDVRGKNAFGARILQRKRFSISKLGVEEIE